MHSLHSLKVAVGAQGKIKPIKKKALSGFTNGRNVESMY